MKESERIARVEMAASEVERSRKAAASHELLAKLQKDSAVETVSYKTEHSGVIGSEASLRYAHFVYVDERFDQNYKKFVREGRWFDPAREDECIVGIGLSYKLWKSSSIGRSLYVNGQACSVIGLTDIFENRVVMLHHGSEDWNGSTQFFAKTKESGTINRVISNIEHEAGSYEAERLDRINKKYLQGQRVNFSLLLLITMSVFLYAMINIGNVIGFMLDDRKERYGIKLAMGCTKRGIYTEFFAELLFITSFSVMAIYLTFAFGEGMIERYITAIRIDIPIILITLACNTVICAMLSLIYMRRMFTYDVITLIRGNK